MAIARRSFVAGITLIATMILAGCGPAPTSPDRPSPSALSPDPRSPVASAPITIAEAPSVLPDDIAHAISQRQLFGLRSDEAWVRSVAADPRAHIELLDFLMLPEEEAEFQARQTSLEEMAHAVTDYAAGHPDEFGGVWIDQPGHTVVAAWTANTELHRLGILAALGRPGPLDVRLVRYTDRELAALQERLTTDRAWLDTIPAAMEWSSVDTMNNRVEFGVSSANPQAPALILAHYGVPADKLRVASDGTGIVLRPRGTVNIEVVRPDGSGPGANEFNVAWTPDRPAGGAGDCGEMAGIVIPNDGAFSLACAPGGWTITIQERHGEDWVDIGSGHAIVPGGGTTDLQIVIDPAPAPSAAATP